MKVLIAIDESDCSSAAFESVLERIWPADVEFRIITVVEPVYTQYAMAGGYCEPIYAAQLEFKDHCREMIKAKIGKLQKAFANAEVTGGVLEGNVASCILSEASEVNADLLIVGSHGRKGFEKFFLGSVAERVAAHSPCSVEIIKEKQQPARHATKIAKKTALV